MVFQVFKNKTDVSMTIQGLYKYTNENQCNMLPRFNSKQIQNCSITGSP